MSDVLNRDTLEYRRSVNTPDFPDPPWLEVPRGSANETLLRSVPTRYLVLTGDTLSEMDAQAKAAVDAQAETDRRAALRAEAETALGMNRDDRSLIIRALARLLLEEINTLRQQAGLTPRTWDQMVTAIVGKLRAGEGEV